MRTSTSLTEVEIQAFAQFAMDHEIIIDGEIGIRNADILCNPIINRDSDITPQALQASFQNVSKQLRLKGATYKKAEELAARLSPAEIDAYKAWARTQKLLIGLDGSTEGYQNVASLLGWMRGNPVTAHNLDLALGNIINNPKVGQRIHFKSQPRQQDRSVVQGRFNHAYGQEEKPKPKATGVQQQEYVNGRKNHAYTSPEEAVKKVATQPVDSWQQIIDIQMKEWTTPGQQVKLQNELNAGLAAGRSRSDISMSLAAIIRDQHRGR
jgi:hypothetical protein